MGATANKAAKFDKKLGDILAAAARVFAAEGYDRASIRLVAERAGMSVPGLYHYVRSKEELLFLIQYHAFAELVALFRRESESVTDPEARLVLIVEGHLARFLGNMAELKVCSRELGRLEGDYRKRIEAKQREYFEIVREIFAELAVQHGACLVDARTAALALFGAINWVYTWYRPRSGPTSRDLAEAFVGLVLRGFLAADRAGSRRSAR